MLSDDIGSNPIPASIKGCDLTKFISIILSICLIISSISFCFASDQPSIIPTSDQRLYNLDLHVNGDLFSGATSNCFDVLNAQLPTATQISAEIYNRFQTIRLPNVFSVSSVNKLDYGHFTMYIHFNLYSEDFSQTIPYNDFFSYFWSIKFPNSNTNKSPRVYIEHNTDNSIKHPYYNSAYLIYSIWVVWDLYFDGYTYQDKYTFSVNYDDNSKVLNLQQNARSIFNFDYCNVIKVNSKDEQEFLTYWFNDILNEIHYDYSQITSLLNGIGSDSTDIYQFLISNFMSNISSVSSDYTIWRLLWNIFSTTSNINNNNSYWRYFFYKPFVDTIFNFDPYDPDDPLESYTINNISSTGLIYSINNLLSSINKLLLYDFTEKEQIKNTAGYQNGQNVSNSINSANGYGSISGIGSNISGMGNMALIPSIFNGISSAFRWFTNETKNNLDMVNQTRGEQETISHYYYDNQAAAESILAGDNVD